MVAYYNVPLHVVGLGTIEVSGALKGIVLGLGLFVLSGVCSTALLYFRLGDDADESSQHDFGNPSIRREWFRYLCLLHPTVATGEELFYRGALIGAPYAAWGLPIPVLLAVSTGTFAVAHVEQGVDYAVNAGVIGAVLGIAFVLSGDLVIVIVAHYVTNVLSSLYRAGLLEDLWMLTSSSVGDSPD